MTPTTRKPGENRGRKAGVKYSQQEIDKRKEGKAKRFLARFESNIFYSPDGCWYWLGTVNNRNRGLTYFNNKNTLAYRVIWIIFKGEIPSGMLICHKCDNPLCVNPDHLFLGTYKDNYKDMVDKGRRHSYKNFCKNGHEFTDENTGRWSKGVRRCKACSSKKSKDYYLRNKLKLNQPIP